MKKIVLSLIVLILGANYIKAQDDDKFGSDPEKCKINLSLYKEFVKQKNYKDAMEGWRNAYNICPKSTKSLYIDGAKIYRYLIKNTKDKELKDKYVDTLMMVYDQRVKYFNQEPYVRGRQGYDLYKYRRSAYEEAYNKMKMAVDNEKAKAAVLQSYMLATVKMYKNKKIDPGVVVENFSATSAQMDKLIETAKDSTKKAKLQKVKNNITDIFAKSGAASCDVLVEYYTPKFEANPKDAELLKTITKFLDMNKCTDTKLFLDASEALYPIEPSSRAAYNIAILAVKKQDYKKAEEYFKKAIELADDNELKAKYSMDLAKVFTKQKSFAAARKHALNAAKFKPGWGEPYLLIGKLYASSAQSCGSDKFEKNAVYWVAVDKFIKAKSVDPSIAKQANSLIGQYKAHFPNKEEAFFKGVNAGDSYTVGCWINESTKARFN